MVAIHTKQSGYRTQSAHVIQLALTPDLSLPYCVSRSRAGMPGDLEILSSKDVCIVLCNSSCDLADSRHDCPSGSHIYPISSPGCIINLPKPAVRELRDGPPQNAVIIKRPGYNIHTRGIQIFCIDLRQWRHYLLSAAVIQIKSHRPGNILQI